MAKYRGSDGWVHDDSVGESRRYENKENLKKETSKDASEQPKQPQRTKCPNCDLSVSWLRLEGRCRSCSWSEAPPTDQPDPNQGPRSKCPNCDLSTSWLRLEGYCRACDWGRKKDVSSGPDSGACCAFLGLCIVCPLVVAGMGYGLIGGGGLLLGGGGLGVAIPIGLVVYAMNSSTKTL